MPLELSLAILGLTLILAVWYTIRFSAHFTIEISGGKIVGTRGEAPESFLKDVETVCKLWSIQRGKVKAFRGPRRIRIEVGGGIDKRHRQAFQTAWDHPM